MALHLFIVTKLNKSNKDSVFVMLCCETSVELLHLVGDKISCSHIVVPAAAPSKNMYSPFVA